MGVLGEWVNLAIQVYDLLSSALGPLPTAHLNKSRTRTGKGKYFLFTCKHGARADDFGGKSLNTLEGSMRQYHPTLARQ